jgi:excinuclease ABC subunit C
MNLSSLKNKISKFPQSPGVYVFKNKSGEIIYIGKATNLRSRVQSYFRGSGGTDRPIEMIIHQVVNVKTIETESVLEALILESNLIKRYQPRYNSIGKDDKSFSYFVVTRETFPRVLILRETEIEKAQSSKLKAQSQNSKLKTNKKIPDTKYQIPHTKIYGPYTSKRQMEIALKIIRKIFPFHSNKQQTEKGCLDFQLGRCPGPYVGAISKTEYLRNIRGIRMILDGKKKGLMRQLKKEMAEYAKEEKFEKAQDTKRKIFALNHVQDVALTTGDIDFSIAKEKNIRIEAYDISNISGQYATGSMVVFNNGEPNKSQYRKFRIKTIQGANDVGMMREVLLRRFKNDWPQPGLIFLDGGKAHLNMGERLLKELGLVIPIVAVAKGAGRKSQIQISNFKINSKLQIPKEICDLLHDKNLIKQIMDEAHRFAIGYHRKLRRKNSLK